MKKVSFIGLIVLTIILATISTAAAAPNEKAAYVAQLSGEAAGTESSAGGMAVFVFSKDGKSVRYNLVVNGLVDTRMAHIHVAPAPGEDGPPVLWLYPDAPPPSLIEGVYNGLLSGGTATSADLTGDAGITTLDELLDAIADGRAYVNVHTRTYDAGEIRGDIR